MQQATQIALAAQPSQLPSGLKRFRLTPTHALCEAQSIVASSPGKAWDKFLCQRFGVLKPSRDEWTIELHPDQTDVRKPAA